MQTLMTQSDATPEELAKIKRWSWLTSTWFQILYCSSCVILVLVNGFIAYYLGHIGDDCAVFPLSSMIVVIVESLIATFAMVVAIYMLWGVKDAYLILVSSCFSLLGLGGSSG